VPQGDIVKQQQGLATSLFVAMVFVLFGCEGVLPAEPEVFLSEPQVRDGVLLGFEGCDGDIPSLGRAPQPGDIINNTDSPELTTLFYIGNDGKRYISPRVHYLSTWLIDTRDDEVLMFDETACALARQVSQETIAALPIGGLITIRPGSFAVKIASDSTPLVVTTPQIARKVTGDFFVGAEYGIETLTIEDGFFTSYSIGADLVDPTDYNPAEERTNADLDTELGAFAP
jgi:hypothetical protein